MENGKSIKKTGVNRPGHTTTLACWCCAGKKAILKQDGREHGAAWPASARLPLNGRETRAILTAPLDIAGHPTPTHVVRVFCLVSRSRFCPFLPSQPAQQVALSSS